MSVKGAFRKQQKNINKYERTLRKDRVGDYKTTRDLNKALYGNLTSTIKGGKARLSRHQERILDRIATLQDNMAKAGRKDVAGINAKERSYGTMGGMLAPSFDSFRASARRDNKYATKTTNAGAEAVEAQAATGLGLMDILQEGTQEAKASAQYETARALSARSGEDAALIAEQQLALDQARLQHQMTMEQLRVQHQQNKELERYRTVLAQKAMEGELGSSAETAMSSAQFLSDAASRIMQLKNTGADPTTISATIMAEFGIDPAARPADATAVGQLVSKLTSDTTLGEPDSVADEVLSVIRSVPGWGKVGTNDKDSLRKALIARWEAGATAFVSSNPESIVASPGSPVPFGQAGASWIQSFWGAGGVGSAAVDEFNEMQQSTGQDEIDRIIEMLFNS